MPRSSFAAEAAARHVPLKRQGFRQFTDTCRVAGLPADPETRHVGSALTRSDAPPLSFAAEAAARRVPLKRQGFGTVRCALWVQLARFWLEARGSLHHDRPHATPSLLPHNLATRSRLPLVTAELAAFLCHYLRSVARQERAHVLEVGIVTTHLHVLARTDPQTNLSRLVQRFKGGSAHQANVERLGREP